MVKISSMTFLTRNSYLFFSVLVLLLSGCAPKEAMMKTNGFIANGNYREAALHANSEIDEGDRYDIDNLLWNLEGGSALLFAQENNASIELFDESEALMKYHREQILASDITQTMLSTLVNDTTRPYIGSEYDGIMSNTYKAINYMYLGDMDSARVEFNRAIDRQRRAKVHFAELITKEREAIKYKEDQESTDSRKIYGSDSMEYLLVNHRIKQNYPSLYAYEPYPDFINPMTTYLAGIFAMADGDYNKAYTLLKESYGMMSDNSDVAADFQEVESILQSGEKSQNPMVWMIFENGQAPILKEWRIDLPVFIVSNHINYISVALPKLVERKNAFEYLSLEIDNEEYIRTKHLSSMDRVIKTEFEKEYDIILKRAILSVAVKTAIQYSLQQQGSSQNSIGSILGLVAAVYQVATTQADTRIWSSLPKEFQLARFSRPDDGKIKLVSSDGRLISEIEIPQSDYTLIYVKIATPNAVASVSVIPFAKEIK